MNGPGCLGAIDNLQVADRGNAEAIIGADAGHRIGRCG